MAEQNALAGLLKKLHAVMQVVDHIAKRGQNKAQNYEYLMAEDVLFEVREEFVKQGLVLLPACVTQEVKEGQSKSGGTQFLTLAHLQYSIYDIETGQSITVPWQGQGQDSGDKGLYKAFTGGSKYWLKNLLMIPTGDDPESDGGGQKQATRQAQTRQQTPPPQPTVNTNSAPPPPKTTMPAPSGKKPDPKPISDAQRKRLFTVAKAHGYSDGAIKAHLLILGFNSSGDITTDLYDKVVGDFEQEQADKTPAEGA